MQNRIFIFFSIGFVLVFFGKINKVDLYHNYFKQIEDVEVRNKTEVSDAGFAELVAETMVAAPQLDVSAIPPAKLRVLPVKVIAHYLSERIFITRIPFLRVFSPRAP